MRGTFLISEESVWNANFDHIWLVLFSFSMYLFPSFYMTLMNWFSNILLHNGGKKNKGFWWTIQSKQLYVFIEEFYIYLYTAENLIAIIYLEHRCALEYSLEFIFLVHQSWFHSHSNTAINLLQSISRKKNCCVVGKKTLEPKNVRFRGREAVAHLPIE